MLILYNPPSNAQRKPILPMSLLALGAVLEGEHDYLILDGNLERDPVDALDRTIRETGADILAVTVMPGPQLNDAVPTCKAIKARHPDLTIIWGGYFPTQHWEACLNAPYVDYVVRGHGEVIFKGLIDALRRGDDPTGLPGLAFRGVGTGEGEVGIGVVGLTDNNSPIHQSPIGNLPVLEPSEPGSPVSNSMAPIPHPDRLPGWPYHRVDVPRYIRSTFMGSRTMTHHSSYGCPFFCNFCAVVNMVNGRWLAHSAERVANDVEMFVDRWGINAVEFDDNNFFTAEARVAEFSERILAAGLQIGWWGEARIDTMMHYSERTWELMRDSGLKMVFLGAESGSNATLLRMNKGGKASTEKTLEIARKMAAYNIVPEMSFVLGNPPDPDEDTRQTIEFIRTVKQVNPATEIIMYMYTPVPLAGELYEQAKSTGFVFPETLEGWIDPSWQEFSQRRSISMPWLNDPIRRQITNFQWVLNAYHPTTTDTGMSSLKRTTLRAASAWRYRLGFYDHPLELRALHKVMSYQRPETTGF